MFWHSADCMFVNIWQWRSAQCSYDFLNEWMKLVIWVWPQNPKKTALPREYGLSSLHEVALHAFICSTAITPVYLLSASLCLYTLLAVYFSPIPTPPFSFEFRSIYLIYAFRLRGDWLSLLFLYDHVIEYGPCLWHWNGHCLLY